jgi:hypothetical protein
MSMWLKAWQLVEWDTRFCCVENVRHFKWVGGYCNFWGCYCNCRASWLGSLFWVGLYKGYMSSFR